MSALRIALGAGRLAALALVILVGFAPTQKALAHASLISSQPEDRAVLRDAPRRVILIFNEPVKPLKMQVVGGDGVATPLTQIVQHNNSVILQIPVELNRGTHALSWRVVSADGHPIGGTLVFSVGEVDAVAPKLQTQSNASVRTSIWALRIAIFVALFLGLGGTVFFALNGGKVTRRATRPLGVLCAAGLTAIPLSVGLQGLDALQLPLSALGRAEAWQAGFATSYGSFAMLAAVALILALLALAGRAARLSAAGALVLTGAALAASGHAASAPPEWLMRPTVWLHVVAVTLWIGSLWPLNALLHTGGGETALSRFNRFIPFVLAALLISGITLAVVELARVNALWTTTFGWILSAKLTLVALLLLLATTNRFVLTRKVQAGDPVARQRLRHSIGAEIVLAVAIFALVAGWRFTPPPRSIAPEDQSEFVHFHSDKVMADVTLTPGRAGNSSAEIMVRDADYQPMTPKGVTLVISQPASGIEPLRREAVSIGDNRWRVDEVTFPAPGRWRLRIEVLVDDFTKAAIEDDIRIRP
jgi:copper transport protein